MVKGNIHQREIVHESPSVELGLYTIRLSVKCYKINEKIYNHIKINPNIRYVYIN